MTRNWLHKLTIVMLMCCCITACQHKGGDAPKGMEKHTESDSLIADSIEKYYDQLIDLYNDNLHDSLVNQATKAMKLMKQYEKWNKYYETWMLLAEDYTFNGEYSRAISEAEQMHSEAQQQGSDYGLSIADYIMGLVYDSQQEHEEAARSLEQALRKSPDQPVLKNNIFTYYMTELKLLNDTARMHATIDKWEEYMRHCRANATERQTYGWIYLYHRSAYLYYDKTGNYAKAAAAVDSVEYYVMKMGQSLVASNEVLGYRTELAMSRHDYAEALRYCEQQLPMASKIDINAMLELLDNRREIYASMNRWQEAYQDLLQIHETADSLNTAETRQQLSDLNKRFEIDALKAQQERETMEHEKTQLRLLVGIGILVVIALVVFIYFRHRAAKRLRAAHAQLQTAYGMLEKTTAQKERFESELRIARDIQMSMVPSNFPQCKELDMYASMTPAREVGGDLYGYILNGDQLYFCIGDVSGKGVPASLFMAQATRLFQTLARQGMQPAEICTRMNEALSGDDNENGMFVTFFIGLANLKSGHLSFCNAGHNPPVIGGSATHGDFLQMEPNAPFGLWPGIQYIGEEIDSIKGRPLFIYTDGLNEAENRQQQQFGEERLLSILRNTRFESSRQVIETLAVEVEKHRDGMEPNDDLTMMCIRVAP